MTRTSTAMRRKPCQPCWSDLIQEALVHVFSYLDFLSLVSASRVCRAWHDASRFPESWDSVHRTLHATFLDSMIKETSPAEDRGILNTKARYTISRSGDRATSICVNSVADNQIVHKIADRCPSLESLSLRDCKKISQGALCKLLHRCKMLKLVDLTGCKRVLSAAVLEEVGRSCSSLIGLNLSGLQVTPKIASALGSFTPGLRWINLKNSIVSNKEVLVILSTCTKLEYLNIKGYHPFCMDHQIAYDARGIDEFKWDDSRVYPEDDSLADNWFSSFY